jgi:hypothetical protein
MTCLNDLFIGQVNIQRVIPPRNSDRQAPTAISVLTDTLAVARPHLTALIDLSVKCERTFDLDRPCTWNRLVGIFRELFPYYKFVGGNAGQGVDVSVAKGRPEVLNRMSTNGLTPRQQSSQ